MAKRDTKMVTFNPIKDAEMLEFLKDKKFSTYCKQLILTDMGNKKHKVLTVKENELVVSDDVLEVFTGYADLLEKFNRSLVQIEQLEDRLKNVTITSSPVAIEEEKPLGEGVTSKVNKSVARGVLGALKNK